MARIHRTIAIFLVLLPGVPPTPAAAQQTGQIAESQISMVASVNPIATDAGIQALKNGGNAVDAAIATALTLGVVDGFNSGIGGGCFIVIRRADGQIVAIDGREMAPGLASRDMYLRNGKADSSLSQIGPLACAVPGALAAYARAVSENGELAFSDLISAAARVADQGFPVSQVYEGRLKSVQRYLKEFPGSRRALLKPDGSVYTAGEILRQPDLATTYRAIAEQGVDWFYQGPFAETTAMWMHENGGILAKKDFKNYKTVIRKPIRTTYRNYEIIGFPPPSSGGVHVAQILNILESFDLQQIYSQRPARLRHVVAEAMKIAFADRAYWLGDPDYVKVPRGLVDKDYALQLAKKIDLNRAIRVDSHGTPPRSETEFFEKHTTHIAAADRQGNWVAITTTVNTTFGSKIVVPGLGVVMNNQMDDFSIAPGVPNAFGLIGAEYNSIAAGKRPLSSMSPTIVLKDGQPVMTVGAAAGPKIITQVVWAIINHLDLGMPIGRAVAAPRVHHQWSPDRMLVETSLDQEIISQLKSMGHAITRSSEVGITQAIVWDPNRQIFVGTHDPRTTGKAQGQ